MKMTLHRYRNWSLATRQFLFLFLVTSAMLGLLAYNNYTRAAGLFKEQMLTDAWKLSGRTNQFLDTYLDNSQNILQLLSESTALLSTGNEVSIEKYLRSLTESNSTLVKHLYLLRSDGRVFCDSQLTYEIIGNPKLHEHEAMARQNWGSIISQPYVSPLSGRTVAIFRSIRDKQGEAVGVAVIELDMEKLNRKIAELTADSYQTFVVLSDKGAVVTFDQESEILPHKPRTYSPELPDAFVSKLAERSAGYSEETGPSGDMTVVTYRQNRLGWSLYVFIKEQYFYQSTAKLYDNYQTIALIWIGVLLFITFTMSRYMTRPIRVLAAKMDRVRDMEVVPNITVTRGDEIGRLTQSYNAMMERVRNLLLETKQMEERKKELELKMLQSQIAPHFLYNTLACIGSLARQHRTEEVKETIRSLVGVLSFSFDKSSEFVTVEEELAGLHQYMQIQKTRYGEKFEFVSEVDPDVLSSPILKLTLQPIVENAIFHGIVPNTQTPNGRITLRASVRRGRLRFLIRDNGVGIEPERLARVLTERTGRASKERFTGIGMANVHDRLRLHYGAPYGLRIGSVKGCGTVVSITIPAESPAAESRKQPAS